MEEIRSERDAEISKSQQSSYTDLWWCACISYWKVPIAELLVLRQLPKDGSMIPVRELTDRVRVGQTEMQRYIPTFGLAHAMEDSLDGLLEFFAISDFISFDRENDNIGYSSCAPEHIAAIERDMRKEGDLSLFLELPPLKPK